MCNEWSDDAADAVAYETMLRVASGRIPDDSIDWDAFHTRLAARAELSLARRRHPRPLAASTVTRVHEFPRRPIRPRHCSWWRHMARWSPVVVPGALAASIALLTAIRMMPKEASLTSDTPAIASGPLGDHSRAVFDSAVVGHAPASVVAASFLPSAAELLIPSCGEVPFR